MGRKINRQARGKTKSKIESNLIAGLLSERAGKAKKSSGVPTLDPRLVGKPSGFMSTHSPASRYTDSKGAADHLGISKAMFFRLRAKGYFQPSSVTGRYHIDDLDSEARGIPATPGSSISAEAATQTTFGKAETTPPLAHGGRPSKTVGLELIAI